jgi:hypothetical protein
MKKPVEQNQNTGQDIFDNFLGVQTQGHAGSGRDGGSVKYIV